MTDLNRRNLAEAFFKGLENQGLHGKHLFARILQDPEAFEYAVFINKLQDLIPELRSIEDNLTEKDPNFYRPMPLMQHMLESIRQSFHWVKIFGAEEYISADAKRYALLWINTALLFHDQGEIAIIKGTNLPLWYRFTVEWTKKRRKNIIRETYPFFGIDTPEGRSYIDHLRHPEISAALAAVPLLRLGWELRFIKVVQFLIRNHSALIEQATYGRLKDGRVLHEDLYKDIASVSEETGIAKEDLLKMLQFVQIMDAKAVKSGMAQIPQETMMRVWMAYSYMNVVLAARNSDKRLIAFKNYRKEFTKIRKELPFGTPFGKAFRELIRRIEASTGNLEEEDRKLLEQELEHFERFEVIREDHIHINNQFNQLLHLIERKEGEELSAQDKIIFLQAYKIAYRSHDGQFRRAYKNIPTGDKRRKYIEHPIKVAKIMVERFEVTDPLTLAAVLFHDVLEDTEIHIKDIPAAFRNEDEKGRIIRAITILTKPESRKDLKGDLFKELAYLSYMARILTAGDEILKDPELFHWLYYVLPRTKAADKIHNRRSLFARKPEGRIKEICRNGNTLLMFMESSNLTIHEKRILLEEFDKSFFEIFRLLDLKTEENSKRFQESLSAFRQSVGEYFKGLDDKQGDAAHEIQEFDNTLRALPQYLENHDTVVRKLKSIEKILPRICRAIDVDPEETSRIMEEFELFLFDISEVRWVSEKGKRKIIGFQKVVRQYKEKIIQENWKPEWAEIIEDLARYAQGDRDSLSPIIRCCKLPDILATLSRVPFVHRMYGNFLAIQKRKLVARLLPRVAMLPVKSIYWLQGNDIKRVGRKKIENAIGGIRVEKRSGRIVLRIRNPRILFGGN